MWDYMLSPGGVLDWWNEGCISIIIELTLDNVCQRVHQVLHGNHEEKCISPIHLENTCS